MIYSYIKRDIKASEYLLFIFSYSTTEMETTTSSNIYHTNETNTNQSFDGGLKKESLKEIKSLFNLRNSLAAKFEIIIKQLGLSLSSKLDAKRAKLIISLLGFELNDYQIAELNAKIGRAHSFTAESLRAWIMFQKRFLL